MSDQNKSVDVSILQYILDNLLPQGATANVERKVDEMGVLLKVKVSAKDMGIVIGRNGVMASAIKTVMRAVGKSHNMHVRVQFLEPDDKEINNNQNTGEASSQFAVDNQVELN